LFVKEIFLIAVIFAIAIAGVALEYARRAKNDSDKENRHQERILNIEKQISERETILANQTTHMLKLKQLIQNQISSPKLPSSLSTENN